MTKRLRTSIILLIILAILLLIAWLLFLRKPAADPVVVDVPVEVPISAPEPETGTLTEQILEEEQEERTETASLTSVVKIFTERYGSYSNESNFANLTDVLPLMSETFAASTQNFVETATPPEEYYDVTTRFVSMNIDGLDEESGVAKVAVVTQREEATGGPQNVAVKFQDLRLTLVQEAGVWKVDLAVWQ